ncbi:MAG: histidine ammonia-lyase [Bacteroidales bacterium]|jgi:histidine ammonia-lyase|nr:histidine ammonia-lyase [Bacteroidales bacterium]
MKTFEILSKSLTVELIDEIISENMQLALSETAILNIERCRHYLDEKMINQTEPIYGITTGFGSLCNHTISVEELAQLQHNLVVSHACGTGYEVPLPVVKIMLLLKIQSLSYGHSGVQLETVERLMGMFNNKVLPVVYQQGSLGASGDLAPLAHLCLPLLGLGEVYYNDARFDAKEIADRFGWKPIELQSKEGLALLNGTQFMSAYAVYALIQSLRLSQQADFIGALSLDAFDGRISPFHELIQTIRHHQGQIQTAANIRTILDGSELINRHKEHVQDPYSFRCMPQVHGASKDAINYVLGVVTNEINAVTDNPTIFVEEDLVISAGNFHGQPLALAMDFLAIAMAELASISERRTYQLIGGKRDLPNFLVAKPGLNSGFMIPQYTAASIVSQNKQLCMPASVDSIESSQGQEDHVSMGANAATKLYRVVKNTERVLAIELFNAAQALEFRHPAKSSPAIEDYVKKYRQVVPFIQNDELMYPHIQETICFLEENPVILGK